MGVQNIIGTWETLLGIVLFLIAFVASLKPWSPLDASGFRNLQYRTALMTKIMVPAMFLATFIFTIVTATSDVSGKLRQVLIQRGFNISDEQLDAMRAKFRWMVVRMGATVLGKSLVSTVFFTDGVVSLMHDFHKGEERDKVSVQCARAKLVDDLGSLYPSARGLTTVHPDDESSTAGGHAAGLTVMDEVQKMTASAMLGVGVNGPDAGTGVRMDQPNAGTAVRTD